MKVSELKKLLAGLDPDAEIEADGYERGGRMTPLPAGHNVHLSVGGKWLAWVEVRGEGE